MIIVGAGGYGCEVAAVLWSLDRPVVGFVDDGAPSLERLEGLELELLGSISSASDHSSTFVVGVGYPEPRQTLVERLEAAGLVACEPIVHERAVLIGAVSIGGGSVLMPNTTVSRGAHIGEHVLINYQASVGHDTTIDRCTTIGPNAAIGGECTIGAGVLVGSGAVVLQGLHIGDGAVIGSGAVVTRDVPAEHRALGVPARVAERPATAHL